MSTQPEPGQEIVNRAFEVPHRYPWPMSIAFLTTVWLMATYGSESGDPLGLGHRERLGILHGCVISFFTTLGLARLAQRKPSLQGRMHLLSALVPVPTVVFFLLLMSVDLASSIGLAWGETPEVQRATGNVMALHLVAVGTLIAFVLPYASGKVDNDRFVYWSLSSFLAGVVGAAFASLVLLAVVLSLQVIGYAAGFGLSYGLLKVLALACYGFVWPWYALSDLPRIDDPSLETAPSPPAPKWLRVTGRGVLLPSWLVLATVFHIIVVPWVLNQPSRMEGRDVAPFAALGGMLSIIGYAIAIRARRQSFVMELWRRWIGLFLFIPISAGLYSLVVMQIGRLPVHFSAILLSLLTWLFFFSIVTLIRREPRTPQLATSFIIVMLAGMLAAPFTVSWFVERHESKPHAERSTSGKYSSWARSRLLLQITPEIYYVPTFQLSVNDRSWTGNEYTPLPGSDFPKPLSVRLTGNNLYVDVRSCSIAVAKTVSTLLENGVELPPRTGAVVLVGQSPDLSISLNLSRVHLHAQEGIGTVTRIGSELFIQRSGEHWPDFSTCPVPIQLQRIHLHDGNRAILPSRSPP